ncbi:hypothetical protein BFR75_08585 [Acinetobacter pittii]|uniref:hypothetical protein n=1 Tax=Acinetobacter pittii TaxID=48296 RepID=UPI000839658F|nr:hypothetical protein [Acinetobacter pittii]OCY31908.1 hypothetical protein BFR75_08585 [Acinetobacter pittii]
MSRKPKETDELKKIFFSLINTSLFKIFLVSSLLLAIILFIFIDKLNVNLKYFSVVLLSYLGVVTIFVTIFENYFFKIMKKQILLFVSINNDLNKLLKLSVNKKATVKEIAISLTYLFYVKKKNNLTKIILILCGLTLGLLNTYYSEWHLLKFSIICITTWGLIILKEAIVEFRIRKGWFGTNKFEAKALIDFLIKNSDDIDFTDGNGKLKRTLFPDTTSSQVTAKPVEDGVTI